MGWHTSRHSVATMLAEIGEHQLTIRDYLRHANLSVTNKYLHATATSKRRAQNKLVEAILPSGILFRNGFDLWSTSLAGALRSQQENAGTYIAGCGPGLRT
jgi:hypothetical protein